MRLIVGNWKMNPTSKEEAKNLFLKVKKSLQKIPSLFNKVKVVVCPPFVYLSLILDLKKKSKISLGAQNVFFEEEGAFTGEISAKMLKDLGVEYVILGHSERRRYLGETEKIITKKLIIASKFDLKPILCVGENEKERKGGGTFEVLKKQLKSISSLGANAQNLIIAYEPVWAIGTGKACDFKKAKEVLLFLKKILKENKILYGGSVNSKNAMGYIEIGFDGLLIGGASIKPEEFVKIVKDCSY